MSLTMLLYASVFFILSVTSILVLSSSSRRLKLPPGPPNLPVIGSLHRVGELPHRSLYKLSRRHGPIMYLKLGSVPTVVASSPATAKEFLKTHDAECCSRPPLTAFNRLTYGFSDVAFSPYGELWRELRKYSIVNLFSARKVAEFRRVREEEAERMVGSVRAAGGGMANLSEELFAFSNNIACRTALGKRYCGEDVLELRRILLETLAMLNGFFFADCIPALGWLDWLTGMNARLERNSRELDAFCQRELDEHRRPSARRDDRIEDAIDVLLGMRSESAHLTDNHIKGILVNIFLGGSETSSTAIEWAMTQLMRNPGAMKKAQNELRGAVGNMRKIVLESDLDQLHYFNSIVKETMRLHPPAPLLVQRETMQACTVNGYDVPARTRLLINAWAIGRDEGVWERPDEFCPERFLNSDVDFRGHDFELIPFGAGRRICPGMSSGIAVVNIGLANLLYHFNWELPAGISPETIDMREVPGLAVHRKSDLCLTAARFLGENEFNMDM